MSRILELLANVLLFEVAWFAAVTGGAKGWPWLGTLPALGVVVLHLILNRERFRAEALLILGVTLLGIAVETAFVAAGLIHYNGVEHGAILPPVWIIALWFGFGTLPHASLGWLSGRWIAQVLLGAIFGPLSYLAGEAMGAATLQEPRAISILAIGIGWAIAMPVIFLMADFISGKRNGVLKASSQARP